MNDIVKNHVCYILCSHHWPPLTRINIIRFNPFIDSADSFDRLSLDMTQLKFNLQITSPAPLKPTDKDWVDHDP